MVLVVDNNFSDVCRLFSRRRFFISRLDCSASDSLRTPRSISLGTSINCWRYKLSSILWLLFFGTFFNIMKALTVIGTRTNKAENSKNNNICTPICTSKTN